MVTDMTEWAVLRGNDNTRNHRFGADEMRMNLGPSDGISPFAEVFAVEKNGRGWLPDLGSNQGPAD
jgi:hypothetical protein